MLYKGSQDENIAFTDFDLTLSTHEGCFAELDVEKQSWSVLRDFIVSSSLIVDFFFNVDS